MIFENKSLHVVVLVDPAEGMHYTKPVRDNDSDDELDCIYQIMTLDQDCMNPTVDGRISWKCSSSCTSDLDKEIECLQNRLNKITTLSCNMMIKSLWSVMSKSMKLPPYVGVTGVEYFLDNFERAVLEQQCYEAMKWALFVTPTQWWTTHQKTMANWRGCRRHMHL